MDKSVVLNNLKEKKHRDLNISYKNNLVILIVYKIVNVFLMFNCTQLIAFNIMATIGFPLMHFGYVL